MSKMGQFMLHSSSSNGNVKIVQIWVRYLLWESLIIRFVKIGGYARVARGWLYHSHMIGVLWFTEKWFMLGGGWLNSICECWGPAHWLNCRWGAVSLC